MRFGIVSALLLLATAALLAVPEGRDLDRELVRRAHALDQRHAALHSFMRLGTRIGESEHVMVGLFVPAAFGNGAARATARIAFLSVLANQIAGESLKWIVGRPRPDGEPRRKNSSFPSTHASGFAGLAWIVARRHGRLALWVWSAAIWVSASRVFLERHFVSDVLAGAWLGIAFAALALLFEERIERWEWKRGADAASR